MISVYEAHSWRGLAGILRFPRRLNDSVILGFYPFALVAVIGAQQVSKLTSEAGMGPYGVRLLFESNTCLLLASVAIFTVIASGGDKLVLAKADLLALAAGSLLLAPPTPQNLMFLSATFVGGYFWWRYPHRPTLASFGQLLVSISFYEAWGRILFRIIAAPVLRVETALIVGAGRWFDYNLSRNGEVLTAPSGVSVYLLQGCSSFHNISLAVLVWLSTLKLAGAEISRRNVSALAIGVGAIVLLNVLRILLMTISEAHYVFWHEGNGASIFSTLTFAAIAAPTLLSLEKGQGWNSSAVA